MKKLFMDRCTHARRSKYDYKSSPRHYVTGELKKILSDLKSLRNLFL